MSTPTPSIATLSVVYAGEDFTVTTLDGQSISVRVRAMPARHLGRVLMLADKEAELLEFTCFLPREGAGFEAVPANWADNLTDEAHAKLYEAAKRLNFSRATIWTERQIAAKQFTGELALKAEEAMMPMLRQIVDLLGFIVQAYRASGAVSFDEVLDNLTLHQMLALAEEHQRDQADQQLRFLQAIRIAVPACLDDKSRGPFEKLEEKLLQLTQ